MDRVLLQMLSGDPPPPDGPLLGQRKAGHTERAASASPATEMCRDLWEKHLVEQCFISVYKAMNSHSFAGLAQEGHCQ